MLQFNFDPFPALTTERLHLRQVTAADAADYFLMRSDEDVMRFIPRPLAQIPDDARKVIDLISEGIQKNETINWGLELKSKPGLIGICGYVRSAPENYRAEIGYILHRDYQRQGFMQEALEKIIDFGFRTMKLHSIEAVIMAKNIASAQLVEKNKFILEGHLKDHQFHRGTFVDTCIYSRITDIR
jgi:ribosomal-protein-alanine N-acetyltransferase